MTEEVTLVASEMFGFYGRDASRIAAKNAMGRRFTEAGRRFWFAVWRELQNVEDQG